MTLRRTDLFRSRIATSVLFAVCLLGCLVVGSVDAQEVQVQIVGDGDVQFNTALEGAMAGADGRAGTAQRWVRGFIQNEFNNVERVCRPSTKEAQALVDVAEKEWMSRLSNTIRAYAESQNQRINADFESRVERLVQIWVRDALSDEQYEKWEQEIDVRLAYRQRIVIGRMVMDCERKYGLTHAQMDEVEKIAQERWKDSWWSMYRTGTLPETKFAWISKVLSESQRTAGTDRASQVTEHFMGGGFVDMPTLRLDERFKIGSVSSSEEIPLDKVEPSEPADRKMLLLEDAPKIFVPDRDPRR
jgi:hypothetical protein